MAVKNPHRLWLALVVGRLNFCFSFRKPISCAFFRVWRAIGTWRNCRQIPVEVCQGLPLAAFLAPLMVTDIRCGVDVQISASDASHTGAGLAVTAGVTGHGKDAVQRLPQQLPNLRELGYGLVSLFTGIEEARRASHLLGVTPIKQISVEIQNGAILNTAEIYPDAIHNRSVLEPTAENLNRALSGPHLLFVVVVSVALPGVVRPERNGNRV